VFLRLLEYYQGVMFLTTNRLKAIDQAVLSRIHFPLRFDNLNGPARRNIWASFLDKARSSHEVVAIEPKELSTLEQKNLNGRQVCGNEYVD
jgi:hypothetical protein